MTNRNADTANTIINYITTHGTNSNQHEWGLAVSDHQEMVFCYYSEENGALILIASAEFAAMDIGYFTVMEDIQLHGKATKAIFQKIDLESDHEMANIGPLYEALLDATVAACRATFVE